MILTGNQKERHALPRWNSIQTAEKLGEFTSTKAISQVEASGHDNELHTLLLQWKTEKSLPLAVEIISTANILQSSEDISDVLDYARKVSAKVVESTPLLNELLFEHISHPSYAFDSHQVCIEKIRKSLIDYPRNPLLWSELSREYTILGQKSKSEKAIHIAHQLAPDNRTILRSIARFYAHHGDFEQATYYLKNSSLIKTDPWVLSSEIALSNELGKTSHNIKLAQKMLSDSNFHPLALSELASELGTMDFFSGNSKLGKRKFAIATIYPHENAIAQVIWVHKNAYNVESIIKSAPTPDCNFEAQARCFYDNQDWKSALSATGLWQEYQPFSREPAMLSSFIATDFLMDYETAKNSLRCALHSNPNDCGLLNNYIYVLILDNQLEEAKTEFEKAQKFCSIENSLTLMATYGLLCYRTGNPELGKKHYLIAIDRAQKNQEIDIFYRASLCLAREEKRCGNTITDLVKPLFDSKYSYFSKQYETIIDNFNLR